MSSLRAYDVVSSDEDFDEPSRDTSCIGMSQSQKGYPIKRKVINVMGRLGSLYDSSTDNLIDHHAVRPHNVKQPSKRFICQVFAGNQSKGPIEPLRNIGFDDAVLQSIRHQMVLPSGISRLIEYEQPITRNTRFLYYSYRARKEKLHLKARKAYRIVAPPLGPTEANCMITKIVWGIEILCVIQIPNNQLINAVDRLLRRIRNQLANNDIPIALRNNDRQLINQLHNITVYGSETCIDDLYPPILSVLNRIPEWQRNENFHQPLAYTMQPLRWLYRNIEYHESCNRRDVAKRHIDRIEPILQRIDNQLKDLGEIFYNFPSRFTSTILNQRLKDFQQHYQILLDRQEHLQNRLQRIIPDVRRHRLEPTDLDNIIADLHYDCLHQSEIERLQTNVQLLLDKAILIEKLKTDRIEYVNAFDFCSNGRNPMTNEAIDALLKRSFSRENGRVILWYTGDRLKREQADKWKQIYQQLTSERQQAKQLIKLVYVDFTQCKQRLENFVIVRLPDTHRSDFTTEKPAPPRSKSVPPSPENRSQSRHQHQSLRQPVRLPTSTIESSTAAKEKRDRSAALEPPPEIRPALVRPVIEEEPRQFSVPPRTEINVLLLGETGVGKSTFINAFVNYLKFESLERAERGEPVVLIPVSFLITIGDEFDEFIVKFGDVDSNEDHEHQGQSVTQHCKSYVFSLNDRLSLRLIDTPGIGDTRGVAQDVKNIDHILTYISTLPHLNAVCLLLKPNASRLNVFFRSCINQLLTYLTPIGYDNIIFCFTNARATFYAPGDTGRLLREMLNQEHLNDIPFQKQNTFCFDSESFRYLAARRCNTEFDDYQKVECKNSWNTSVAESVRLLKFIQTRQPYGLQDYQSPRKATLDIAVLARPLMETLRLIIFNWKLSEAKIVLSQMRLSSNPLAMEICTNCAQVNIAEVGPFWLAQYQPPPIKTSANQHRLCPSDGNNFLIEAVVQHTYVTQGAGLKNERWQSSFHNFLVKCDRLYHFFRQQGPSAQEDPFGLILDRFVEEEEQISQIRSIDSSKNRRVREVLQTIRQIRQQNSQQLFESDERLSLRDVYQIIDEFLRIRTVKEQIDSIQRSRELIMKTHERRVSANLIQNKTFN